MVARRQAFSKKSASIENVDMAATFGDGWLVSV